ncbi:hypothetical protein OM33_00920 [Pseudoalteromonas piratica]|uniref:Uncharacterized protein n=1 Tax=Pseudoalteromonas piratica TaxID=1348114 RepID=A0A0A7ECW3_9GAMM|nr:hypothetical protein OM33_00920 [Pseudoalteromonas piratica]
MLRHGCRFRAFIIRFKFVLRIKFDSAVAFLLVTLSLAKQRKVIWSPWMGFMKYKEVGLSYAAETICNKDKCLIKLHQAKFFTNSIPNQSPLQFNQYPPHL